MTTRLTDDREAALRVGYRALQGDPLMVGVSFDQYSRNFEPWRVRAIEMSERVVGAFYDKDSEIHIAVLPEWHGKWVTRQVLCDMFDMPKVITRYITPDSEMRGYLLRLGFVDVGDDMLVLE